MELSPLRQRLIDALHVRHMSPRTEDCYVRAVARFSEFFGRSPARLGPAEIELYLLFLRDEKRVSWCWFNQTVCALRFFYQFVMQRPDVVQRIPYGKREKHLPVVLSQDELVRFLGAITNPRDRVILGISNAVWLALGVLQPLGAPLGAPLGDSLFLHPFELPRSRLVHGLYLANQDERHFGARMLFRELQCPLVGGEGSEIVLVPRQRLGAIFGMEPNAVFKSFIVEVSRARFRWAGIGSDS